MAAALAFAGVWALSVVKAHAGLFDEAVSGELDVGEQNEGKPSVTGDQSGEAGESTEVGEGTEVSAVDEGTGSQDSAASDSWAGAVPSGPTYELGGYIRGTVYAGKMFDRNAAEIKNAYAEPALKIRVTKGSFGDAYGDVRFRAGYVSDRRQMELDVREAYVNLYPGPFDFRLGHQVIVWGRADGFNPTNNLTPFSWRIRSPDEDDQRLANLGLRGFYNIDPFRVEAVWIPLYAGTELPQLPFPDFVTLTEDYPDANPKNSLGAGRIHLILPAVELSASYLYGYAPMPGIAMGTLGLDAAGALSVTLARTPYRQHVAGLDFAAPVGDVCGLRGEAAYRRPEHYRDEDYIARPDIHYVLGVDREFGDVMVIAQYIGRYAFGWEENDVEPLGPTSSDMPTTPEEAEQRLAKTNQMLHGQTDRWQHSASLRVQWKLLYETLSVELTGLVNAVTAEWMARPKVVYDITDALEVAVGGEILGGPDDTLFGMVEEIQSAGYGQLLASF